MKPLVWGTTCLSLILGGCGPIIKELRHPGGYPGSILDERLIDGSKQKSAQLLRAAIIIAMASRMATATIRDGKDADAFTDYLAAATEELNYAASNIYNVAEEPPCLVTSAVLNNHCRAYYVNFEADIPLLEGRIVRLMLAALPENRARAFLEDVTKGNVLGAAWSAIRAISDAAGGLRRSAAVFRSSLEIAAVLENCKGDPPRPSPPEAPVAPTGSSGSLPKPPIDANMAVDRAAACFQLSTDQLFDKNKVTISRPVPEGALRAVLLLAETACARLPVNSEGDILEKATQRNKVCQRIRFAPQYRPIRVPAPEPPPPSVSSPEL